MDLTGEKQLKSLTDLGKEVLGTAENLATDRNTMRHKMDMTSAFKLPQLIRPIMAIWSAVNETILGWATIVIALSDNPSQEGVMAIGTALASNTVILTTIVAYYFKSRKEEKIAAKNASANIEIKKMELEAEIEREELILDSEMDDEKLDRAIKKRENRRKNRWKPFKK